MGHPVCTAWQNDQSRLNVSCILSQTGTTWLHQQHSLKGTNRQHLVSWIKILDKMMLCILLEQSFEDLASLWFCHHFDVLSWTNCFIASCLSFNLCSVGSHYRDLWKLGIIPIKPREWCCWQSFQELMTFLGGEHCHLLGGYQKAFMDVRANSN